MPVGALSRPSSSPLSSQWICQPVCVEFIATPPPHLANAERSVVAVALGNGSFRGGRLLRLSFCGPSFSLLMLWRPIKILPFGRKGSPKEFRADQERSRHAAAGIIMRRVYCLSGPSTWAPSTSSFPSFSGVFIFREFLDLSPCRASTTATAVCRTNT